MPKPTRVLMATIAAAGVATASVAIPVATSASPATYAAHNVVASKRGSIESKVHGTFGRAGTVHGSFVPARAIVKHGQTYVQGDLTATLRRANGSLVGHATRHNLNIPLRGTGAHTGAPAAAAATTCTILHLVLGPLHLNLLGLHVDLNRVVLNITAHSGSGNLLGNLLCAVAHLLDSTPANTTALLRLENALNRIIGLL